MATTVVMNEKFNGEFKVLIRHAITNGYTEQTPIVEDGVTWETERQGSPGKLTFRVFKDKNNGLHFSEGDVVILNYKDSAKGWVVLFYGYIFTKQRSKDGWIKITAYDLLRYFKNKHTYVYNKKKASDLVKMIANDYKFSTGTIENTSYVIGSRVEDDQSLFDIIQNALDLTITSTNKLYVLYVDNNKICLRDANNMKLNVVINEDVAEDFDYSSSIDDETYNDIELYYDNDETNKREYYHSVSDKNLKKWGRLRYTESLQTPTNAKDKAKKMLELYNQKTRKLQVKKAFGDYRCRAGASVIVDLDLGDITGQHYMMIEKAKHTFKNNEYRMDLTLGGRVGFTE